MAKYEDSAKDKVMDRKGAKKTEVSLAKWEKSPADRKADAKGQKALNRKSK